MEVVLLLLLLADHVVEELLLLVHHVLRVQKLSVDHKEKQPEKDITLLEVKWSEEVSLTRKVQDERRA